MKTKRRMRVHPGVACTAMVCLTILAVTPELLGHSGEAVKILVTAFIFGLLGVKFRHKLPLT